MLTVPKTPRSRRTVTISDSLVATLQTVRARQAEVKLFRGTEFDDQDFVFATKHGSPISARNLLRKFYTLVAKADIPKIRFHDLRHTHATLLPGNGVNISVVSERLGHSSPSFTLNTYAHVIPDMQEALASRLDDILGAQHAADIVTG